LIPELPFSFYESTGEKTWKTSPYFVIEFEMALGRVNDDSQRLHFGELFL